MYIIFFCTSFPATFKFLLFLFFLTLFFSYILYIFLLPYKTYPRYINIEEKKKQQLNLTSSFSFYYHNMFTSLIMIYFFFIWKEKLRVMAKSGQLKFFNCVCYVCVCVYIFFLCFVKHTWYTRRRNIECLLCFF